LGFHHEWPHFYQLWLTAMEIKRRADVGEPTMGLRVHDGSLSQNRILVASALNWCEPTESGNPKSTYRYGHRAEICLEFSADFATPVKGYA
jgi:hypothetical protein